MVTISEVLCEMDGYLRNHQNEFGARCAHLSVHVSYGDLEDWANRLRDEIGGAIAVAIADTSKEEDDGHHGARRRADRRR